MVRKVYAEEGWRWLIMAIIKCYVRFGRKARREKTKYSARAFARMHGCSYGLKEMRRSVRHSLKNTVVIVMPCALRTGSRKPNTTNKGNALCVTLVFIPLGVGDVVISHISTFPRRGREAAACNRGIRARHASSSAQCGKGLRISRQNQRV